MAREYHQIEDGEWRQVPWRGSRDRCCDCGLVHVLNYRIKKDKNGRNRIEVQAFRDGKATGGAR